MKIICTTQGGLEDQSSMFRNQELEVDDDSQESRDGKLRDRAMFAMTQQATRRRRMSLSESQASDESDASDEERGASDNEDERSSQGGDNDELFDDIPEPYHITNRDKEYQRIVITGAELDVDEETHKACADILRVQALRKKYMQAVPQPNPNWGGLDRAQYVTHSTTPLSTA